MKYQNISKKQILNPKTALINCEVSEDPIYFNIQNKYKLLSNLIGGTEFEYIENRFPQQFMKDLLVTLKNCDIKTFIKWLRILQPKKSEWTTKMEQCWFFKNKPIHGILARLLCSMFNKDNKGNYTQYSKLIQHVVLEELNLKDITIEITNESSEYDKKFLMKKCLRKKYNSNTYRSCLISTGSSVLHDKGSIGSFNDWTYPGGDWLGKLLMEIRSEILYIKRPIDDINVFSNITILKFMEDLNNNSLIKNIRTYK